MNTLIDLNNLHTEWGVATPFVAPKDGALFGSIRRVVSWSGMRQWDTFLSRMHQARPDLFEQFSADDLADMKRFVAEEAALFFNPSREEPAPYNLTFAPSTGDAHPFADALCKAVQCFLGAVHNAYLRTALPDSGYLASDETGWSDVLAQHKFRRRFLAPCLIARGELRGAWLSDGSATVSRLTEELRAVDPVQYSADIDNALPQNGLFFFFSSEDFYDAGSKQPVVFSTADKARHLTPVQFVAIQAILSEHGYTPENITKTLQKFIDDTIAENNHD